MSVVEEVRQTLQDVLAPDIREIKARLDALEARLTERFHSLDDRLKTAETQREIDKQDVLRAIDKLGEIMSIKERLARLESSPRPSTHQ